VRRWCSRALWMVAAAEAAPVDKGASLDAAAEEDAACCCCCLMRAAAAATLLPVVLLIHAVARNPLGHEWVAALLLLLLLFVR